MRFWPRRQVYVDDLPKTHDLRFAALFVLAFSALLAGLYAVGYFVAGDRLPSGTTVAGIDVGGMSRDEARSELQDTLARRLDEPMTIVVRGESIDINPQRAGMTFDLDATIDASLGGQRWDPAHMLRVVTGGGPADLVVEVDQRALSAILTRLDERIARRPVSSSVVFRHGKPAVHAGRDGRALDYDSAQERLVTALAAGQDKVHLRVRSIAPKITATAASDFVRRVAGPAASGRVTIRVARTSLAVAPRQFVPALRAEGRNGHLRLRIDPQLLMSRTRTVVGDIPQHPVNATFAFRDDRPVLIPGRSGVTVDPESWAAAVLRATGKQGPARRAVAEAVPDSPSFTTDMAKMLRIRERVASAAVPLSGSIRQSAVRPLTDALDGTLTRPQAGFSFLARVGASSLRGSAPVASASYQAALKAGMSDLVRSPGQYFDPSSGPGLDARVALPSTDLAWRNETPYGVYIRAWVQAGVVHVEMWSSSFWQIRLASTARYDQTTTSTELDISPGCQPQPGVNGFDVDLERIFSLDGERVRVERSHSTYAPRAGVVCVSGNKGAAR